MAAASVIARHYVQVGRRLVHLRRCGHGAPVLLLHESPRSSAAMTALMAQAPPGVAVLALDTPGNGLSTPLPHDDPGAADCANCADYPDYADYADALAATLDALGIARAAVCGRHSGAAFATALALRHPQRVARLVLDGISAFDAAEQADMLGDGAGAYLTPFEPRADGGHMAWLWNRVRDQALFYPWHRPGTATRLWRPVPRPDTLQATALDLLLCGDAYRAPYRAAIRFNPGPALAALQVRADVAVRASDVLRPHLARLPALPAHVRLHGLPDDAQAAGCQLWQWLADGAAGLPDAPPTRDAGLPPDSIGDTLVGAAGGRLHLRGSSGGNGRPLVLLHPSPGSARALDGALRQALGQRPVLAIDLPGHGESDSVDTLAALLDQLQATLADIGWQDAELRGDGLGAAVAHALSRRALGKTNVQTALTPQPHPGAVPVRCHARADGGHLLAAWQHARGEAVLGGWWQQSSGARHDMGAGIDLATVQARAVAYLMESDAAQGLRRQWLGSG